MSTGECHNLLYDFNDWLYEFYLYIASSSSFTDDDSEVPAKRHRFAADNDHFETGKAGCKQPPADESNAEQCKISNTSIVKLKIETFLFPLPADSNDLKDLSKMLDEKINDIVFSVNTINQLGEILYPADQTNESDYNEVLRQLLM